MKNIIKNRKATFEFTIMDKFVAGIQLLGTEVKSIKESRVSISEAFCVVSNNEVYILGMHVSDYMKIKYTNHKPIRDRKLLLNKNEIKKIAKLTKERGLTIVPLAILLTDTGLIKVEIALAKGKKLYDKKNSIIERETLKNSLKLD